MPTFLVLDSLKVRFNEKKIFKYVNLVFYYATHNRKCSELH